MPFKYIFFCLWFLLSACSSRHQIIPRPLHPDQIITTEGHAIIKDGAKLLARKMAIRDAIREASMEGSSQITSHTKINRNTIALDAFTLKTSALINQTKVVDEWIEGDIYHIRAIVRLTADKVCTPQYRKRIVSTGFPFIFPSHTSQSESNDLQSGIPREIGHLLAESGAYISYNKTLTRLFQDPNLAPQLQEQQPYQRSDIISFAQKNQSQLVLSGVIRDLEAEENHYTRGGGILSNMESYTRYLNNSRTITLDIYVHDGYTGALLFQHRYKDNVSGLLRSIWIPANVMVGSSAFKKSITGEAITHIINHSVSDIQASLNCYPFYTRILKIEGNQVFIDAGAQERISAGDQLVVYSNLNTIEELSEHKIIGLHKKPVGVLTITEVTPLFSVGEMESPPYMLGIAVGDWVKSW